MFTVYWCIIEIQSYEQYTLNSEIIMKLKEQIQQGSKEAYVRK
ncbi:hypothetical protein [Clostridium sp.]